MKTNTLRAAAPLAFVLALLPILASCQADMESTEEGSPASARRVLIAGTTSEFKRQVVVGAIARLGTRDYYFKIVGLDLLEREDTAGYGAVVLVNAYEAGRIDGRVRRFLSKDPADPKAVVFTTRGGEGPKPIFSGSEFQVDAVSSVSAPDAVEKRAGELADQIRRRFP